MTEEERQLMEQLNKQLEMSNKIAYSQYQLMQKLEKENREIKEAIKEFDHGFARWITIRFWIGVVLFVALLYIIAKLRPYIEWMWLL